MPTDRRIRQSHASASSAHICFAMQLHDGIATELEADLAKVPARDFAAGKHLKN